MTTPHEATQLLQVLFGKAPHHLYLEIRPLEPHGGVVPGNHRFLRLRQLQRHGFEGAVPTDLDGRANIYFGVCLRMQAGGRAQDVALATCLWVDEIRKPWPEFIPLPTAMVETSPGKHQAYWLLDTPTEELGRVERLNRRLAAVLGGDNVGDRARIMRLPGFRNVKIEHPDRPLARLVTLHPDRRYGLDQLEAVLPPQLSQAGEHRERLPQGTAGPFDPHAGGADIPQVVKEELATELVRLGAKRHHDGRLLLPCPFPSHASEHHRNFYLSPHSGRWWCFGEHHRGRRQDKVCVTGGALSLWAALFPGRSIPRPRESPTNTPRELPGGNASNSPLQPYSRPAPANLETCKDAPARKRSAALLRSVGATRKADAEGTCGVPLKGWCTGNKGHGVVREGRATGKTPWCSGCHTETSARYLRVQFPAGSYSILRLRRRLGHLPYDARETEPGLWEIDPDDGALIQGTIENEYVAARGHFRRVQRRYEQELLGWHFAVGEDQDGLWVELQVLARHNGRLAKALYELTGGTRKAALFVPDAVVRYDYGADEREQQLRREWAGFLKTALLALQTDCLFRPIYEALNGRHLSQAYGDLRAAYEAAGQEDHNGQLEDVTRCPVLKPDGQVCGAKLSFFLDPEDKHAVNPLVYEQGRARAKAGLPGG